MNFKSILKFTFTKGIVIALHIAILILSGWLIYTISVDTFNNIDFYARRKFEKQQFWICVVFLADFFIEFFMAKKKGRYLCTHFIFFLVAIPYQALIYHFGIELPKEVEYLIRYIPLIRGGYAMAIVVSWFTYNRAAGLFVTYLIILISTVYFASLTFYLFEYKINPEVHAYKDAVWWAAMDVTTVGCNIEAVTTVGRILSVLLAALGMMMFPIFTVYVTNLVTQRNKEAAENGKGIQIIDAYKEFEQEQKANTSVSSAASGSDKS